MDFRPRLAPLRPLAPALPRQFTPQYIPPPQAEDHFTALPPELRTTIYKYVLADTRIEITPIFPADQPVPEPPKRLPPVKDVQGQQPQHSDHATHDNRGNYSSNDDNNNSHNHADARLPPIQPSLPPKTYPNGHPLAAVSRLIRNEVLPILHEQCPIHCTIRDFDFAPLLEFYKRIPPNDVTYLKRNANLTIELTVTGQRETLGALGTMRNWLAWRADECKVQPDWTYQGLKPCSRVVNDLRRRLKRMSEVGKRKEFEKMCLALNISIQFDDKKKNQ